MSIETGTASVTEARDHFREIIDSVCETGNEFVIAKHGKPVAVILAIDEYESLVESLNILSDDDALAAIREAESEPRRRVK